jgi:methyl-accepting chemotaxis protein
MSSFDNLPIIVKSLVAPALGAVLSAAIVGVFLWSYVTVEQSVAEADRTATLEAFVSEVMLDVSNTQSLLFRAVSQKQANVDQKFIDETVKEALALLDEASGDFASVRIDDMPEFAASLATLSDSFKAYRPAADLTLKTLPQDAFMASMHMNDTQARYLDLKESGTKLVHVIEGALHHAEQNAQAAMDNALYAVLGTGGASLLIALAVAFAMGRTISGPIRTLTTAMRTLADGDTGIAVPAIGRKDEVGRMAETVQVFKEAAIEKRRLEQQQEELKRQAEADRRREMAHLAEKFEADIKGVVDAVAGSAHEMQATSQAMSATAEQTSHQAATVAQASEQATVNVQTVATAAEELSSSIREIARQMEESDGIAKVAATQALETQTTVQSLMRSAEKIGEIVGLINSISSQTNLLALNATIEAARAGEAGKGFAVVASEVKALAHQTAKATDEIAAQIETVRGEIGVTVGAIETIVGTINRINQIVTATAAAVEEQGAATQEIARNVDEAARGTRDVNSNISSVTQAAGETGAAAGQVLGSAQDLARQSESLRAFVGRFVEEVRAA